MYGDDTVGYSLQCETILLEEHVEMEGRVRNVFSRCGG